MKTKFFIIILLFLSMAIHAQQKDISVFEKKDGDKNIVVARNIGKVPYIVKLDIRASGMLVEPGIHTETVVPAGFMKDLATLTPKPGESWTYGYDVSFVQYTANAPAQPPVDDSSASNVTISKTDNAPVSTPATTSQTEVDKSEIIIYSKPGCSRCAFVKKSLTEKGIKYKEVDVTSGSPEVNDMWMNLRHGGFSGESVTMPVVKVKGQLHYNIKDLQQFVNDIQK